MASQRRRGYQTAEEFYEEYYREKAREAEKKEIPTFGRGGPLPVRKQNVGLLMVMAAAIGAVAFWNKNRKTGTRLGKEPKKPAARRGLSAGEAAAQAAQRRVAGAGLNQLTPLGKTLAVAQKVDQFEAEAKALEEKVRAARVVEEQNKKEQRRLIEVVTQAQIEMDGIKVEESARALKKAQIVRMERIIVSLEHLAETAHKGFLPKDDAERPDREETEGPS